jgi:hypothetical protein
MHTCCSRRFAPRQRRTIHDGDRVEHAQRVYELTHRLDVDRPKLGGVLRRSQQMGATGNDTHMPNQIDGSTDLPGSDGSKRINQLCRSPSVGGSALAGRAPL